MYILHQSHILLHGDTSYFDVILTNIILPNKLGVFLIASAIEQSQTWANTEVAL